MKKLFILILFFVSVLPSYSGCWKYSRMIEAAGFISHDWGAAAAYKDSLYIYLEKIRYNWTSTGVYSGSILWKTTDQGKTYSRYYGYAPKHPTLDIDTIPGVGEVLNYGRKIEILNKDSMYIATSLQFLLRTYDGGKNWEKLIVMSEFDTWLEDRVIRDFGMHPSGLGVFCYQDIGLYSANEYLNIQDSIIMTTDNWATSKWVNISKTDKKIKPWRVHIIDSNNIFVICRVEELQCMILAKSTDRGDTWTNISLPTNPLLLGIYFLNENEGWIGGSEYDKEKNLETACIYKTTDGGINWNRQMLDSLNHESIQEISFINQNEGYAFGGSIFGSLGANLTDMQTYHTTDGANWIKEYPDTLGWKIGKALDMSVGSPDNAYIVIGSCIFQYNPECSLGVDEAARPPMPEEIKVFPNPLLKSEGSNGTINIGNTNGEILENVYLYDITGNELTNKLHYNFNAAEQFQFSIEPDMPAGSYMLVLQFGLNRIKYCKVVVE